jgi:hypothetical protein
MMAPFVYPYTGTQYRNKQLTPEVNSAYYLD